LNCQTTPGFCSFKSQITDLVLFFSVKAFTKDEKKYFDISEASQKRFIAELIDMQVDFENSEYKIQS